MPLKGMLRHRCDIERAQDIVERGITRRAWTTIAQDVPCSVQPTPADRVANFGTIGVRLTHTVYMARSVKGEKDRLRIRWDGKVYMVRAIENTPMRNWPTQLETEEQFGGGE